MNILNDKGGNNYNYQKILLHIMTCQRIFNNFYYNYIICHNLKINKMTYIQQTII